MPYISQASIQELTDRMDAVAVVSDYVQLENRGGRFWARCPFHQEKTGSFTVSPDLKTYYCFGCHKGGSVINFVMEMDKLSFPETLEHLAKKFGVELVYENSGGTIISAEDEAKKKKKEELFEIYQRLSGTFHHFLLKKREAEAAKRYIITRGIFDEMIERFCLGYAPDSRYWLHDFLSQKGYSPEFLASSGLFSQKDKRASFFSGRLMFPIRDRHGRTVAFGGRALPGQAREGWEPPKYINSPELPIYRKGETFYAADLAMPEIRRTKTAYVAEGYLDVIALHQAGITNAIAPLGTAFTDEQAKLLKRWAEKIILFFDSDEAGQTAAVKGIYTCRRNGLGCSIVAPEAPLANSVGGAKDPAEILQNSGPEELLKQAKCFINDFDYLLKKAVSSYDTSGSEDKARAVAFLFPYLDLLDSEVARVSRVEAVADAFGLLPDRVTDDYNRYVSEGRSTGFIPTDRNQNPRPDTGDSPVSMNEELSLLFVIAIDFVSSRKEKLFQKFRSALEIGEIEDPNARDIFIAMEECIRYDETGMERLLARISSPSLKKLLVEKSVSGEFSVNAERLAADGLRRIGIKRLERQQEDIIIKLRAAKKNVGSGGDLIEPTEEKHLEVNDLLTEKMRLDEELSQLMKQGRQV
ncbi:MAG: DNA primase [Treponema sp.]|jgi:DNA primase|nr:DNA primase [Treponema sp.]